MRSPAWSAFLRGLTLTRKRSELVKKRTDSGADPGELALFCMRLAGGIQRPTAEETPMFTDRANHITRHIHREAPTAAGRAG